MLLGRGSRAVTTGRGYDYNMFRAGIAFPEMAERSPSQGFAARAMPKKNPRSPREAGTTETTVGAPNHTTHRGASFPSSAGHQAEISQVFRVLSYGIHLPVWIPTKSKGVKSQRGECTRRGIPLGGPCTQHAEAQAAPSSMNPILITDAP